jgi:hypothetical protein
MMIRLIQELKVANEMLNRSSGRNIGMQLNMGEVRDYLLLCEFNNSISLCKPEQTNIEPFQLLYLLQGKTCLIAISLANEDQMCRVTVLKSIFETNFNSFRHTLGGLLDQRVYSAPCRRDLAIGENAPNILKIYKNCMKNRGIVVALPEHRLFLRTYRIGRETQAKSLIEIQRWIDENTRDILDESDEILSVK